MRQLGVLLLTIALGACASSITPLPPHGATPAPARGTPVEGAPSRGAGAVVRGTPTTTTPTTTAPNRARTSRDETDQPVRVALATGRGTVKLSAVGGAWSLYDRTGEHLISRARAGDVWTVDQRDGALRASSDFQSSPTFRGPLVARPQDPTTFLVFEGKRYRGELLVLVFDTGLTVINRLSVESYLRGVVPLEIGTDRTQTEIAAVRAQAVAARSYTYTRLSDTRVFDLTATVTDQVYGGADAERPVSDAAVSDTRDQVLMYNGKVINAPYHANSGGCTASPSEVWRTDDQPYLVPVSDRIPGTDRFYCEQSPKFRWTRTFDAAALQALAGKYLRQYARSGSGPIGQIQRVYETGRTASGRVAALVFETDRGRFTVRGNDIRFVLRSPGGDILPSTMFTLQSSSDGAGSVILTLQGTGMGHGVGMDQWGAIARSRAGQDYLTILRTYYPGTTVGHII